MSRKMLWVLLLAAMPAVVCAQERVTNCRTLEEAGNFVGPDEVIMNDLVCTKVKPGAQAVQPVAPKPLPGAVISNGEATNVVEAAKAASKRVAAAKDAIKAGQTPEETSPESETPAAPGTDSVAPAPPVEAPKTPPTVAPPVPPPPAAKPPIQFPVKPPTTELAAAPEPAPEAAPAAPAPPSSELAATAAAKPAENQAAAPAEVTPAAPAAETATSESAISAQPAAAAEPAAAAKSEASEAAAAPSVPATPSAEASPAVSEAAKPAESPAAEKGSGFSDANVGANVVTNPRPEDTAKPALTAPEPASAPAEAAAEPANAAPRALTPAEAEAQASLLAPDPNLPRERVVETGSFAKPREEAPDPEAAEHTTTFQPGDIEGFQEGQRAECTKNITLGGLKGEKLVLGTPEWAARWIEKNQKHMPQMCFSDTPMKKAKNYLIVFYTAPAATNGNEEVNVNSAMTPKGTPAAGVGAFTLSYGSTWHYAVDRTVGVTVLTRDEGDEPYSKPGQVRYATAYTEEGVPVAEHWPEKPKKDVHLDEKNAKSKKARQAREVLEQVDDGLLDQMVEEIAKL